MALLSGLVISLVLGSIPNGAGTMLLQVFCFSKVLDIIGTVLAESALLGLGLLN